MDDKKPPIGTLTNPGAFSLPGQVIYPGPITPSVMVSVTGVEAHSVATPFGGTVVRKESDGFTIIRFDEPLGPSANNFGLISSSTGTATVPLVELKPGVHVSGTAEAGDRDLAAIKTVRIDTGS